MTLSSKKQILSIVSESARKNIDSLFNKTGNDNEFEFIFFSKKNNHMSRDKYILLLKYMRAMATKKNYGIPVPELSLDVVFSVDDSTNKTDERDSLYNSAQYRISIVGYDEVYKMIERCIGIPNKNFMILKFVYHQMKREMHRKNKKQYNFMMKEKNEANMVDIEDLSMRVRLSKETDLLDKIALKDPQYHKMLTSLLSGSSLSIEEIRDINKRIVYRLKERTSLYIDKDENHFIRIDVTDTKTTNNLRNIKSYHSNYELEIEYGVNNAKHNKVEYLDMMYDTCEILLKLLQQSSFIVTNSRTSEITEYYRTLLDSVHQLSGLYARQTISLEIQHVTELLPNKYAVSDKADGDRMQLIIYKKGVYLISSNLNVRDTGIILDNKFEHYNGTILDGECIYLQKYQRYVFMVFDCVRSGSKDMRQTVNFFDRLNEADKIIEECFVFKGQTGFKFKDIPSQKNGFDIGFVRKFYGSELVRFYSALKHDAETVKIYPLIRRKFFMPVLGAVKWEIFDYSVEFWNKYTEDATVNFPYSLDGLVYHPIEQNYDVNPYDSKYHEYKWKPPQTNSIDFYIEFKRDQTTGEILDVYDNSDDEMVRNKTYRICTLYVGKSNGTTEQPVPFDQNEGSPDVYMYIVDGEVRDINGDIILDKSVVEFYYQNDNAILPQRRWIPIKTRYDKTESVEKYGKRYGNYVSTALRVWRSIINPVLMSDFIELAKGNTEKRSYYDIKVKDMNSKISHSLIVAATKENKYYQKQSKLASIMRQFHNFIKSNLIYTYCEKMYQGDVQQSILDIACGRGGDIEKFYYTNVAFYVGFDADVEGLKSPIDGAISRYNRFKKKKPNFPKMYFLQADGGALLGYDAQLKALGHMDDMNKKMLEKFFPETGKQTKFDRVNCQFAIHYFLKDRTTWNNFKTNINNSLKEGGYLLGTVFDARTIVNAIGDNEAYTVTFDDTNGVNKIFFDVKRSYGDLDRTPSGNINIGNAIDLFATWMFDDGNYMTEYLVDINFLIEELGNDCNMELVDTDLFANQYEINRNFLLDSIKYESVADTQKYLRNVSEYYQDTEMNKKCLSHTNLMRYFVFRKKYVKSSMGGAKQNDDTINKIMNSVSLPEMNNYNSSFSFLNSLHKILVSHKIIPHEVMVDEFALGLGLDVARDVHITDEYISNVCNKCIINHEIPIQTKLPQPKYKKVNVLNGVNLYIIDCDAGNSIKYKKNEKTDKTILLLKRNHSYKPIFNKDPNNKDKMRGIFRNDDGIVLDMLSSYDAQ